MSADVPTPLSKVDSAVQGLSSSPPKEKRRASSSVPGVFNINDLGMSLHFHRRLPSALGAGFKSIKIETDIHRDLEKEGTELLIAKETQKLNWYVLTYNPNSLSLPRTTFESVHHVNAELEYQLNSVYLGVSTSLQHSWRSRRRVH